MTRGGVGKRWLCCTHACDDANLLGWATRGGKNFAAILCERGGKHTKETFHLLNTKEKRSQATIR
jgi:hypothetical protein